MNERDRDTASVDRFPSLAATAPAADDDLYRSIVMLLSEGVVVQDAAGAIIACNASAERILGLSRDQMLGRTSIDPRWRAVHRDGSPFPGETHPAMVTLRTGQPQAGVIMGIHKPEGTLTWILVDSHPLIRAGESAPQCGVALFQDITDQMEADRELGESEERYRTLLTMSPDGISVVDETGRILDCNEQFVHLHGYDRRSEIVGRNAVEFTRPEEYARWSSEVSAALASDAGVARDIECEVVRRDGSTLVTENSIAQVPWPDAPSGVAYLATVRDITKRRELMEELAHHQARLEAEVQARTRVLQAEVAERAMMQKELASLQALGAVISLRLPLGEFIQAILERLVTVASLDMAQLFLLKGDHLQLAGVRTGLAGQAADSSRCVDLRSPQNDRVLRLGECLCGLAARDQQPMYLADVDSTAGRTRDCCETHGLHSLAALPLRSGDKVIGVLVVGVVARDAFVGRSTFLEMAAGQIALRLQNALLHQDMRDRAAALEETTTERSRELQTERDRTQAILETVGESVIVTDLDGQVLFLNPAAEALTGFSRDDVLGQPIWHHWSAQAFKDSWPQAQMALSRGQPWKGEVAGYRKDGTVYVVALTATPLHDERAAPHVTGGVWVQRDVTTIKEAERLKDQFVSNVSHELRTPISILALSCDNLDAFYDRLDEGERRQILQGIHDQTHLLSSLVEDILNLSQIDSGRAPKTRSPVDLAGLVRAEVERQRHLAEQHSLQLNLTAAAPVTILGNEVQLRQVVRNLLDNALKYTLAGGRISCTCEIRSGAPAGSFPATPGIPSVPAPGSWAVVEVVDGGIGIAAEDMPFLFERFYRVNAEGEIRGTGLGLSIAKELAVLHGGRIDVASSPGQGSTFTVYLPLWEGNRGAEGRGDA